MRPPALVPPCAGTCAVVEAQLIWVELLLDVTQLDHQETTRIPSFRKVPVHFSQVLPPLRITALSQGVHDLCLQALCQCEACAEGLDFRKEVASGQDQGLSLPLAFGIVAERIGHLFGGRSAIDCFLLDLVGDQGRSIQ